MKHLIIGLLLFPLGLFSQESFDFIISPDLNFRKVTERDSSNVNQGTDNHQMNLRFGMNYNYRLKNTQYLKVGARFTTLGFETVTTGVFSPLLPERLGIISEFNYFLEFPIAYRKETKRNSNNNYHFIELGVSPYVYIKTLRRTKVSNLYVRDYENVRNTNKYVEFPTFQFSGNISVGGVFQIKNDLHLIVQPTFRFHLRSVSKEFYKFNYFNYGLQLGIRKTINNNKDNE